MENLAKTKKMEEDREGMSQDDVLAFNLYKNTMTGEWGNIVKMYEEQKFSAIYARINSSGDTALHVAVSLGPEDIVLQLIRVITLYSEPSFRLTNNLGNTPLHVAASAGRLNICILLAKVDVFSELPSFEAHQDPFRNKLGETPLFLAAFHGHKIIFLYLHSILLEASDQDLDLINHAYRRYDGETALHCAIRWEYFDVAFEILAKVPNLAYSVNKLGITPLHLLASKPSVFKSGSHLGWWKSIIYHCTHVEEPKYETVHEDLIYSVMEEWRESPEITHKFPKNYQTCIQFYQLLQNMAQSVIQIINVHCKDRNADVESAIESQATGMHTVKRSQPYSFQEHQFFRRRYSICFDIPYLLYTILKWALYMIITWVPSLEKESKDTRKIKEKHIYSVQIMKMLVRITSDFNMRKSFTSSICHPYSSSSGEHLDSNNIASASETDQLDESKRMEASLKEIMKGKHDSKMANTETTPITLAAIYGITDIVEQIVKEFPLALNDEIKGKNIVHLAVQNRQPQVLLLLLQNDFVRRKLIHEVDMEGNNALHLAAKLGNQIYQIPRGALQMQWEVKWYEFVKDHLPSHFSYQHNNEDKSPEEIFYETHINLFKDGSEWLKSTSNSCCVVATLIATVVFPASTTVPGGINDRSGTPILEKHPAFNVFAISSLVALCLSIIALFLFLTVLTSQYQQKDFRSYVPRKLLLGLTLLFVSIGSMLISFCAGHFFLLKNKLQDKAFPVYAVICLPIFLLSIGQYPLYFHLLKVTLKKVPQPTYKVVSL